MISLNAINPFNLFRKKEIKKKGYFKTLMLNISVGILSSIITSVCMYMLHYRGYLGRMKYFPNKCLGRGGVGINPVPNPAEKYRDPSLDYLDSRSKPNRCTVPPMLRRNSIDGTEGLDWLEASRRRDDGMF